MQHKYLISAFCLVFVLSACATDEYGNRKPMTEAEKGALIGAGIGALIGLTRSDRKKSVVLGAVGGGIAGGLVGTYMDKQQKDLEKVLKPEINDGSIRLEKLPQNNLRIGMTSATAFDIDSSQIQTGFHSTLEKISVVLNKYGKTELVIVGHTDSTGSDAYNQALSERRASSVENYLLARNVIPQRLSAYGKGESQPLASNQTVEGRLINRRVEIYVVPLVAQ